MKSKMRECLPCTACCEGWLQLSVDNEDIYPGKPCSNCSKSEGCQVYDERPREPCQTFFCGWRVENSPLPDWFRPDIAKVIVLPNKFNWRLYPVDVAVPVGRRIPPRALQWLMRFTSAHQRLLVFMEQDSKEVTFNKSQQCLAYGPPLFRQEIEMRVKEGDRLWE